MPRSRQPRRSQGASGRWQTRRIPQPGLTTFTPLPAPLARSLPVLALCTAQQRSQERGVAGGAPCGSACGSADRASNLAATSLQCCSASACEMGLPTGSRMDSEWDSSTTAFRSSSARDGGRGGGRAASGASTSDSAVRQPGCQGPATLALQPWYERGCSAPQHHAWQAGAGDCADAGKGWEEGRSKSRHFCAACVSVHSCAACLLPLSSPLPLAPAPTGDGQAKVVGVGHGRHALVRCIVAQVGRA